MELLNCLCIAFSFIPFIPYPPHIADAVPRATQAVSSGFRPWIASKCSLHAYFLSGGVNFLSISVAPVAKKYAGSCRGDPDKYL
jgi:hypothetical protein